ncbi:MAG: cell division protein ZapB [Deltaproteobacteria bacterium]|nr:cell division protein ZapB [Deltaproteobacteria bacterium]
MNEIGDVDQFQLLEEKIDSLIALITDLRKEKELLAEQVQIQEMELADLNEQVGNLNTSRDGVKQRIVSLLEKINQIDV